MKGALLWKRILNEGVRTSDGADPEVMAQQIVRATIVVDNTIRCGQDDDFNFSSIKVLPMPFNLLWVEGPTEKDDARWGALMMASGETNPPDGTRLIAIFTCLGISGCVPYLNPAVTIEIGRDAVVHDLGLDLQRIKAMRSGSVDEAAAFEAVAGAGGFLCPALVGAAIGTVLILGCKNVSLKPTEGESSHVKRAIKRHGGSPDDYRYHTLVVRPPGARHDSPGQDIGIMSRHVCRGHFAEYGDQFGKGLLFGRYSGRFYVPPCLKGDKKNGIVEKDYAIAAV